MKAPTEPEWTVERHLEAGSELGQALWHRFAEVVAECGEHSLSVAKDDGHVQGAAARLRRRAPEGRRARRLLRRDLPGRGSAHPERRPISAGHLRPSLPGPVDGRRVRRSDPRRVRVSGMRPAMRFLTYADASVPNEHVRCLTPGLGSNGHVGVREVAWLSGGHGPSGHVGCLTPGHGSRGQVPV